MSQKNDTFKEKMTMISVYLKRRHMSHALQVKVKKYFEYYFKNILVQHPHPYLQDSNDECDKLMERLTNELKRDVKTDIHKHTLKSCQLLQESFSEAFLRDLSQKLHVVRYNPGDLMFQQNSIVDKLTFVLMGEVKVFVSREGTHLPHPHREP
jgi:preprotein translocase subunit SecA